MLDLKKIKIAELSLIYAAPMLTDAKESSRLAGLQRKLQKTVQPYLKVLNSLTPSEINDITKHIDTWGEKVGWWNSTAPLGALVSFYLDVVENSVIKYHPKIMKLLVLLAEHLEDGNELKYSSCDNAAKAAQQWKEMYE